MQLRSKIDKTIILLIIITALSLGEIMVVGQQIVGFTLEIDTVEFDIQSEYARRERYKELLQSYTDIEEDNIVKPLEEVLPSSGNFLAVIEELEGVAAMSGSQMVASLGEARLTAEGLELASVIGRNQSAVGATKPAGAAYDFLEIEINLRGSYEALQQFISLLTQSKYYFNITSMTLNRINSGGVVSVNTYMTVQVFVQTIIYR